ncbi:Glycine receptor subunit alpha-2 [Armadillidium vulgare]|nr:Glycine receptor subunit alpha-2 [Armadillidium vulgare]
MGTYIKGEDMKILYTFVSTMDVPCSFDLHKYPFGKQSCTIAFMTQNNEYNPNTKFEYAGNITDASNLFYNGSKQLGEYNFASADHRVDEYGVVVVTIHLVNLYGFHMLNSFVPSVLICIITYSTLFFPIKDFSDRVMLSLTALLVLAALFTQSSNSSVITPYFKLLDIWYVVLIFYCFMIVIYNIWLRKFTSIEERKAKDTLLNANEENLDEDCDFKKSQTPNQWKKKLVFYNFVAIIFFSTFYILFLFFFCLAAAEKAIL